MNVLENRRSGIVTGGSRPMRASRPIRTGLRTAHVLASGALYGGHVFGVDAERLFPALVAVVATGTAFLLFEVFQSPIWLVQVRGAAIYCKLGLLLAVDSFWDHRVLILTAIVAIGTVVSHMPSRYRYYSFLHRREMPGDGKG